jgi:hypothetical protein
VKRRAEEEGAARRFTFFGAPFSVPRWLDPFRDQHQAFTEK